MAHRGMLKEWVDLRICWLSPILDSAKKLYGSYRKARYVGL